ncbi:hypothetical protein [Marinivivus vitaminiproducens]|uniref:hypothetical protein n=1 Tax=Marinivivus vitaminiproducens TaxID=3035935 RepID=UPI00279C8A5B|nr:hypothetical protein P4R82_24820 [Geminicoccaceae bacterium SCSIO 64248]
MCGFGEAFLDAHVFWRCVVVHASSVLIGPVMTGMAFGDIRRLQATEPVLDLTAWLAVASNCVENDVEISAWFGERNGPASGRIRQSPTFTARVQVTP